MEEKDRVILQALATILEMYSSDDFNKTNELLKEGGDVAKKIRELLKK